uniref:G-protein coupled receptors family 1 profile domain-containing protein n=1 Tax=Plectus sambesii TaxID=2011161 RepID=A0A914WXL3_9BILA
MNDSKLEFMNFTMNTTTVASIDFGVYYRYEYTGFATIIANLIILSVIVTDRGLRERLLLYFVLAIGDILNGCYFGYANFMRLQQMKDGTYFIPTSKWDCAKKFYSFFQLTGTQFPALIALLISIERVLAVQKPIWYHA